ncbi:pyridoxine 5'-phosphate synthase [Pelagibacterales bacterium SAG-MED17]|nr:pyridoxine 5'-phosphate synthase [Pelagibacterales bacterium SAG-MED17]
MKKRLGVNIDHVATLRNARGEKHPDPYTLALDVLKAGADSITVHLREDRRHINDIDLKILSSNKSIPINLEIASDPKIIKIALKHKPSFICLVPEKRNEVTTEGGLNLKKNKNKITKILKVFNRNNIRTSLFINPSLQDIKLSKTLGTKCIEIHTGKISNQIKQKKNYSKELNKIKKCASYAKKIGLEVHAGHGMDYKTTKILNKIKQIQEFNIGHFIIGESLSHGISKVVKQFIKILR